MKRNWKLLRSSNLEKSIGTRWWSTDWCTEGDAVFNRKSPKLLEKQQHEGEKTVLFLDIFICREGDISTPLFSFLMACFEVIHVEADRSDLTSAVAQRKKKKKNREWVKKGEWEKQTWRWLWWWCCPVLRGCSPVLWWPRVRGRRGHVVKTRWVHSWNIDGQQNFYYFFKDAVWRSQGVAACLYNYLHNKKDKEKKQDTDRERGTAWFAPRGCTFLTYVQRDKKKSALTYKCKKTRLQTISTFIDYEEERKKESERNLQNKMQNLELQLRWL